MKKLASAGVLLTASLSACFPPRVQEQPVSMATAFIPYPVNGGPPPGTIVRLDDQNRYEAEVISRERILRCVDPQLLAIAVGSPQPAQRIDRTADFRANLGASGVASGTTNAVSAVQLSLPAGSERKLQGGESALSELIQALPRSDLQLILDQMTRRGGTWLIVAVDQRPSGSLTIRWNRRVGADATEGLRRLFGGTGSISNSDSLHTVVTYSDSTRVAFTAVHIDSTEIRQAMDRAGTSCNRPRAFYPDRDRDGFGSASAVMAVSAPVGHVDNNGDCYDGNANAFPGQTKWFAQDRGDGSFDYNCNGRVERRWTQRGRCSEDDKSAAPEGWWEMDPPAPGQEGEWLNDCDATWPSTRKETGRRRQEGR